MKRLITRQTAICVALLVLLLAGTASAIPFLISDCTTITQPGSYIVTNNITATSTNTQPNGSSSVPNLAACIVIAADFVTLDLSGFAITGSNLPSNVDGIATSHAGTGNLSGVEVRNGTVANFTSNGVVLLGVGHRVDRIRALHNFRNGITVSSFLVATVEGHRVTGNTAIFNSGLGIQVACPAVVLENVAIGNGNTSDPTSQIFEGTGFFGTCTSLENSPAP